MNKFSTGLIIGGMIGAAGLITVLSDKKSRHKLESSGSKLLNKASDMIDEVVN